MLLRCSIPLPLAPLAVTICCLAQPCPAATAGTAKVWVLPPSGTLRTYSLDGTREANGRLLREILENIVDGSFVTVEAPEPQVVHTQDIHVAANNFTLQSDPNLLIRPIAPYDYVISCIGNRFVVQHLNVDGAGDQIRLTTQRGGGIVCDGEGYLLEGCQVENLPPGTAANGVVVRGCREEAAAVRDCVSANPGYACFRCSAVNATFDNIAGIIDERATPEQMGGPSDQNRLFNLDTPWSDQEFERVVIRNSRFEAHLSPELPPNGPLSDPSTAYRQVGLVLDPGDLPHQWAHRLEIVNTTIHLNDQVQNQGGDNAVKIVNIEEVLLDNVVIETPRGYRGKALRLGQETELVGISQEHKPRMRCTIRNCWFDRGIWCHGYSGLDDYSVDLLRIEGVGGQRTVLGMDRSGNVSDGGLELLSHFGLARTVEIENADLYHIRSLAFYDDVRVPATGETTISLRNVTFSSLGGDSHQFVFRFSPPHASFLNALDFEYGTANDAAKLWLANGCARRLAATSRRGYDNTVVFDPSLASAACRELADSQPLPPFADLIGAPGARIYLASGWTAAEATALVPEWQQADFWEWMWVSKKTASEDGSRGAWQWAPSRERAKRKSRFRMP
jgi:hypothetical protein